jgi:hypothetical protein
MSAEGTGFLRDHTLVSPRQPQGVQFGGGTTHQLAGPLRSGQAAGATPQILADQRNAAGQRFASGFDVRHRARAYRRPYNANPSSMRAGIDVLAGLGVSWLVMGDMAAGRSSRQPRKFAGECGGSGGFRLALHVSGGMAVRDPDHAETFARGRRGIGGRVCY